MFVTPGEMRYHYDFNINNITYTFCRIRAAREIMRCLEFVIFYLFASSTS